MSISFLLVARQKKRNRRKKRKHANVPCISLTLNAKMLFELSAQILSRLTIALRARSPDLYQASLRAKRSNPGKRSRNRVRDDRFLHILPATCHRGRRKPVRDLWIASSQNIGLDYSGCRRSNVRFQLTGWGTSCHGALPKIRPRNDVKCAALSLAALKDFVCKANETYVHLVEAMPQAAQKSFACFFFCLLLQLRALLETCKMASLFHSVVNGSLFLFASQLKRKSEQ